MKQGSVLNYFDEKLGRLILLFICFIWHNLFTQINSKDYKAQDPMHKRMFSAKILVSLVLMLLFCTSMASNTSTKPKTRLNVTKVRTVIINNQNHYTGANFSLFINFKVNHSLNDWAFGFYMPRTFNYLQSRYSSINPNMTLTICTLRKHEKCAPLVYVDRNLIKGNKIYGDGWSNIFTLKKNHHFSLEPEQLYQLVIKNSNQGAPKNLNSMPQSFFLVINFHQPQTQKIITTNAKTRVFGVNFTDIAGYNPELVERKIANHILKNWKTSIPISKSSLARKLHIVPLPNQMHALKGTGFTFSGKEIT